MENVVSYDADLPVDASLYPTDVVLRACYRLTDRYYVFLSPIPSGIRVQISRKLTTQALGDPKGELSNHLIDEAVRLLVRIETGAIRERIVQTALAEATGGQA